MILFLILLWRWWCVGCNVNGASQCQWHHGPIDPRYIWKKKTLPHRQKNEIILWIYLRTNYKKDNKDMYRVIIATWERNRQEFLIYLSSYMSKRNARKKENKTKTKTGMNGIIAQLISNISEKKIPRKTWYRNVRKWDKGMKEVLRWLHKLASEWKK